MNELQVPDLIFQIRLLKHINSIEVSLRLLSLFSFLLYVVEPIFFALRECISKPGS